MRGHVVIAAALAVMSFTACDSRGILLSTDAAPDPGWDPWPDPDVRVDDPRPDDPPYDPWWPEDPEPDFCTEPPVCMNAPPDHARLGQPCISEMDCGSGNRCLTESVMVYDGETYVSWLGGTCTVMGADSEGCDPRDPTTCPSGTRCVYLGSSGGSDYHGCLDACSSTDTSWNPYDWNCGCREGYRCDIVNEACLPGCANDRECCEVWEDLDYDYQRDDGEVYFDDDCTNYCDGDDEDEYPSADCMASFDCINFGDPDATYHSTCLFDSDCPADALCLNEVYHRDPATDRPLYPDGLCIKRRCELIGRGCEFGDLGECVNLGTTEDPRYTCIATCTTGLGPEDGDLNPCRNPSGGHPYTCRPHPPERWFPAGTHNGICMPALVPECSPVTDMYERCTPGDRCCASPKGLGQCLEALPWPAFCSAHCDRTLAETHRICGAAPGSGAAPPGVCALGSCLPSCTTPHAPPGTNGCPDSIMACYPNDGTYGGHVAYRDPAGSDPAGFCLRACTSSEDCAAFFGAIGTCDITSGVCG